MEAEAGEGEGEGEEVAAMTMRVEAGEVVGAAHLACRLARPRI